MSFPEVLTIFLITWCNSYISCISLDLPQCVWSDSRSVLLLYSKSSYSIRSGRMPTWTCKHSMKNRLHFDQDGFRGLWEHQSYSCLIANTTFVRSVDKSRWSRWALWGIWVYWARNISYQRRDHSGMLLVLWWMIACLMRNWVIFWVGSDHIWCKTFLFLPSWTHYLP